jgi:hypothetical protein
MRSWIDTCFRSELLIQTDAPKLTRALLNSSWPGWNWQRSIILWSKFLIWTKGRGNAASALTGMLAEKWAETAKLKAARGKKECRPGRDCALAGLAVIGITGVHIIAILLLFASPPNF